MAASSPEVAPALLDEPGTVRIANLEIRPAEYQVLAAGRRWG